MDKHYLRMAIELAATHSASGENGPFGAVLVNNGKIVGTGWNRVVQSKDPTAHAEIVAIREACAALQSFSLEKCTLYTSCEPCPMCLSAIYWARIERIVFAGTKEDAARAGFDDAFIYREIGKACADRSLPILHLLRNEAKAVFEAWRRNPSKRSY
ncbi:MAG: nucleoside deaminase [Chitinivibrionales bacterium]|nr:nucleoside deaminase [Chitinivibrionales bacterium]